MINYQAAFGDLIFGNGLFGTLNTFLEQNIEWNNKCPVISPWVGSLANEADWDNQAANMLAWSNEDVNSAAWSNQAADSDNWSKIDSDIIESNPCRRE